MISSQANDIQNYLLTYQNPNHHLNNQRPQFVTCDLLASKTQATDLNVITKLIIHLLQINYLLYVKPSKGKLKGITSTGENAKVTAEVTVCRELYLQ